MAAMKDANESDERSVQRLEDPREHRLKGPSEVGGVLDWSGAVVQDVRDLQRLVKFTNEFMSDVGPTDANDNNQSEKMRTTTTRMRRCKRQQPE
jgi:hypothetical protein